MPLYRFELSDIFDNVVEANPQCNFLFYEGFVYYNNKARNPGYYTTSTPGVLPGHVSLYELNVDRLSGSTDTGTAPDIIYPFVYKTSDNDRFKTITLINHDGQDIFLEDTVEYGDLLTGSYPMSASVVKEYFHRDHVASASFSISEAINAGSDTSAIHTDKMIKPRTDTTNIGYTKKTNLGSKIAALRNTLDSYMYMSHHYAFSSASLPQRTNSVVEWNKAEQEIGLLSIPSIFYGQGIEKGSVNLKFYVTGTLIGELQDERENGELIQIGPPGSYKSGSVAGVVLYNEGFLVLTGSWDVSSGSHVAKHTENYVGTSGSPRWIDFAQTIATGSVSMPSSSFQLDFKGTQFIPTMTMLAHARKGHLNFSNNPTYIKSGQTLDPVTSSVKFREQDQLQIKNIVSSSYDNFTASYKRQTYISKIGIYDENKNLIGVAKVARPIKKTEDRDFTFKLKLDL